MRVLIYHPEHESRIGSDARRGGRRFDGVRLAPGRNTVEDADYQTLTNNELFVQFIGVGVIEELNVQVDRLDNVDITKITTSDVHALIQSESNKSLLAKWLEQEKSNKSPRKEVINVISAKLKTLEGTEQPVTV